MSIMLTLHILQGVDDTLALFKKDSKILPRLPLSALANAHAYRLIEGHPSTPLALSTKTSPFIAPFGELFRRHSQT